MVLTGPTSHTFVSQRMNLRYADWGNPDAPPMLLVHGGRDHSRSWDWVAQEFKDEYHVIAPDLRGHGDSDWSADGNYMIMSHVYDIAQLIHQKGLAPVTIIAHSMGGDICLRYAGIYPDTVKKLVVIDGAFPEPKIIGGHWARPVEERMKDFVEKRRSAAARQPKRYETQEEAYQRMKEVNKFLTDEQAKHLTVHGMRQNEDGTYTWKFDNYTYVWPSMDLPPDQTYQLWEKITCPVLLVYGKDSFATAPNQDDRMQRFKDAELVVFDDAGHWLHHDQFDKFVSQVRDFL